MKGLSRLFAGKASAAKQGGGAADSASPRDAAVKSAPQLAAARAPAGVDPKTGKRRMQLSSRLAILDDALPSDDEARSMSSPLTGAGDASQPGGHVAKRGGAGASASAQPAAPRLAASGSRASDQSVGEIIVTDGDDDGASDDSSGARSARSRPRRAHAA